MMTDRLRLENQSRTRMMNDATGVALMTAVIGRRSVSTIQKRDDTQPSTTPSAIAMKKPPMMRTAE